MKIIITKNTKGSNIYLQKNPNQYKTSSQSGFLKESFIFSIYPNPYKLFIPPIKKPKILITTKETFQSIT